MVFHRAFTAFALLNGLASAAAVPVTPGQNDSLPVVDLGYELHQANFYNDSGRFYNFSNIRYGAAPIGPLRWNLPQSPDTNRSAVQTGLQGRICPQGSAAWLGISGLFTPEYLAGQTIFNSSSFPPQTPSTPTVDGRETEDCLFLDVVVPEDIFTSRDDGYGAPVLVWIHGGGYAFGSKSAPGDPSGLLARSQSNGQTGVVFVSINYRLGAFGFLGGSNVQENGTANAGIHDQRLALKWIQDNIHLFGGDPKKVTVFGESAGGGSILSHITAFGGSQGPAPFAQALLQSPAFSPPVSVLQQEQIQNGYLSALNVSTIDEARQLPYAALYKANLQQLGTSDYGRFAFGPVLDGSLIPDLPGKLLAHGLFDKTVRVMTAHNSDEGLLFTSPFQQNNSAFEDLITLTLPDLSAFPDTLEYITETLYPPIFNDSSATPYSSQVGRAALFNSELIFACNAYYVNKAFLNNTHSYLFSIANGLHAADIGYSFYNGVGQVQPNDAPLTFGGTLYPEAALVLQGYITQFAMTGNPNGVGLPYLPRYGHNATMMEMNGTAFSLVTDPVASERCEWLQKGLLG